MKSSRRLSAPLRGIVPPLVTPLLDQDTLDRAGLERLVEHVVAGGVSGVFLLGTTGEGPSLSSHLRRELVASACQLVAGRVPVLVGVTDTCLAEALKLATFAADAGADAIVTSAPYYFPLSQAELLDYVACVVREAPLPVFLYNMPSMTKTVFEPATVRRAMDWEDVVGIKDSSGDLTYFRALAALAAARPDWTLLMGPEHLLADSLAAGGHGGVHGGANIFPRLFVDLYDACSTAGDPEHIRTLRQQVDQVGRIYRIGKHSSQLIAGLKASLALLGICSATLAHPLLPLDPAEKCRVGQLLHDLGLLQPCEA